MRSLVLMGALGSLALAASAAAAPAPPGLLVIHHHVADYAKWRPHYDADKPARDAAGLTGCQVRASVANPNDVFVACEMADVAKAKAFTASKRLAAAMKSAGVTGKPDLFLLTPPR